MTDKPARANSQKVVQRPLRIVGAFKLLLQSGEHVFFEVAVYALVFFDPFIADRLHIRFLVFEVLIRVILEELYALAAYPLGIFSLFFHSKKLVYYAEKLPVLLVNAFNTDFILDPPFVLIGHVKNLPFGSNAADAARYHGGSRSGSARTLRDFAVSEHKRLCCANLLLNKVFIIPQLSIFVNSFAKFLHVHRPKYCRKRGAQAMSSRGSLKANCGCSTVTS